MSPKPGAGEPLVAAAAARLVQDGMSVSPSSGGNALRMRPWLAGRQGHALTVRDLSMATIARSVLQCEVHVTAGTFGTDEPGLVGPAAEFGLRSRPMDLSVIALCGVDTRGRGVSRHAGAARLNSAAVRHSAKAVAVSHRPDFSATEDHAVCSLGDLSGLTLNHDLQPAVFDLLSEHRLRIDRKAEELIEFVRAEDLGVSAATKTLPSGRRRLRWPVTTAHRRTGGRG